MSRQDEQQRLLRLCENSKVPVDEIKQAADRLETHTLRQTGRSTRAMVNLIIDHLSRFGPDGAIVYIVAGYTQTTYMVSRLKEVLSAEMWALVDPLLRFVSVTSTHVDVLPNGRVQYHHSGNAKQSYAVDHLVYEQLAKETH